MLASTCLPCRIKGFLCPALFALTVLCLSAPAPAADLAFTPGTVVHIASKEETARIISHKDGFLASMGTLDRAVRMGLADLTEVVPEERFFEFLSEQALDFTDGEKAKVEAIIPAVKKRLAAAGLPLRYPSVVTIAKTVGKDEGGAAYCRGPVIFLPEWFLKFRTEFLERIVAHEFFHVYSNSHTRLRPAIYGVLGFKECNEVPLPDEVRAWRVTNPDSFENRFRLTVLYGSEEIDVMPVHIFSRELHSSHPDWVYHEYAEAKLLVVEERGGRWAAKQEDGQGAIIDAESCPDYYLKVAQNTTYLLQPEEILAVNWLLILYGAAPHEDTEIVGKLRDALLAGAAAPAEEVPPESVPTTPGPTTDAILSR